MRSWSGVLKVFIKINPGVSLSLLTLPLLIFALLWLFSLALPLNTVLGLSYSCALPKYHRRLASFFILLSSSSTFLAYFVAAHILSIALLTFTTPTSPLCPNSLSFSFRYFFILRFSCKSPANLALYPANDAIFSAFVSHYLALCLFCCPTPVGHMHTSLVSGWHIIACV